MKEDLGRWAVELLLKEAWGLYREGRYDGALRAAQRAVEEARALKNLRLRVRATTTEAAVLTMLGDEEAALLQYTWLLGLPEDPSCRDELRVAGVEWEIANAYGRWALAALFLPTVPTAQLLGVLDAAEAYLRSIGKPTWRAGVLQIRARVLKILGRIDEAIGFAEEGLVLEQQHPGGPGGTLASHRGGWATCSARRSARQRRGHSTRRCSMIGRVHAMTAKCPGRALRGARSRRATP